MKDMTRRDFLRLSGAAALAVSAGALTACSGGGGGASATNGSGQGKVIVDDDIDIGEGTVTVISETGAKPVSWVKFKKNIYDQEVIDCPNSEVGDYNVYPVTLEGGYVKDYGLVMEVLVNIANYSGRDLTIGVENVMVCLDGTAVPIVGLAGGDDMDPDASWSSSIVIHNADPGEYSCTDRSQLTEDQRYDQSRTVCVYIDARGHENAQSLKTVMQIGNSKAKFTM